MRRTRKKSLTLINFWGSNKRYISSVPTGKYLGYWGWSAHDKFWSYSPLFIFLALWKNTLSKHHLSSWYGSHVKTNIVRTIHQGPFHGNIDSRKNMLRIGWGEHYHTHSTVNWKEQGGLLCLTFPNPVIGVLCKHPPH